MLKFLRSLTIQDRNSALKVLNVQSTSHLRSLSLWGIAARLSREDTTKTQTNTALRKEPLKGISTKLNDCFPTPVLFFNYIIRKTN